MVGAYKILVLTSVPLETNVEFRALIDGFRCITQSYRQPSLGWEVYCCGTMRTIKRISAQILGFLNQHELQHHGVFITIDKPIPELPKKLLERTERHIKNLEFRIQQHTEWEAERLGGRAEKLDDVAKYRTVLKKSKAKLKRLQRK